MQFLGQSKLFGICDRHRWLLDLTINAFYLGNRRAQLLQNYCNLLLLKKTNKGLISKAFNH